MSVLIFLVISYILLSISLFMLFKKTEVDPIKGLIPGVNFIEWCKLIGRKPIYALWLLFPIVNIFIFCGMAVDLVRSFRHYSFLSSAGAVIYAPAKFALMAMDKDTHYDAPTLPKERAFTESLREAKEKNDVLAYNKLLKESPYTKSAPREWTESIVFAVFAAAFIRMFLIEAYVIPTPSMEGSLLVGDFLFVSKAHYGIRTPMTVAMVPLLHNTIPGLKSESYLKKPQLPYYRLPAIEEIDKLEPIVFNWPVGDSVFLTSSRSYSYQQVKDMGENRARYDRELAKMWNEKNFRVRPIDKKDHYIKRCTGTPGDSLQIIDSQIYINGEKQEVPSGVQLRSLIILPGQMLGSDLKKFDFLNRDNKFYPLQEKSNMYEGFLTASEIETLRKEVDGIKVFNYQKEYVDKSRFNVEGFIDSLSIDPLQYNSFTNLGPNVGELMLSTDQINQLRAHPDYESFVMRLNNNLFPQNTKASEAWTNDNYGPIYIPKKGDEVIVTPLNLGFYAKVIGSYEGNDLKVKQGRVYINGEQVSKYKFKQNYYWAMGDNRHNSEDSRVWGFVPEDHIVGKPLFVWFSLRNGRLFDGIRFKRIFQKGDVR